MIIPSQIGTIISFASFFPKRLIEKKNRFLELETYSNKKRRFYFLSNIFLIPIRERKTINPQKLKNPTQIVFFSFLLKFFSYTYLVGYLFNYLEVFFISIIANLEKIFNLINFIISVYIGVIFFSKKIFEKQFLNKIFTCFIYLNLASITEKCFQLSGYEQTWILLKVANNFIFNIKIWSGKNNFFHLSISDKNENQILWVFKTLLLSLMFLDITSKIFFIKFLNFYFDEILSFPSFLLNLFIFFKKDTFTFHLTDLWLFSTIGSSFALITFLAFIYSIAFVKVNKDISDDLITTKKFLKEKFLINRIKNVNFDNSDSNLSNLNSSNIVDSTTIKELLDSEKKNSASISKEDNSRWKIKKKGIKTPFLESIWSNELPLLKQNLWYEIKSR